MQLNLGLKVLGLVTTGVIIAAIAVPATRYYKDHARLAELNALIRSSIDQWQVYDSTDPASLVAGIYQSIDEPNPLSETLYTQQGIEFGLRESPGKGALHLLHAPGTKIVFKPDYDSQTSVLLWTCEVQFGAHNRNERYGGAKTNAQVAHHYFPNCTLT